MPFCWPSCSLLFCLQLFSLSLFFSIGWLSGARVFGLNGCQSPSPGLALPIFFNNNKNNNKWWSTLKSAVFGSFSSLPLLISKGGGLVCESVGKADLLSEHFDSKQSKEAVDLPLTCHPSRSLTTFCVKVE